MARWRGMFRRVARLSARHYTSRRRPSCTHLHDARTRSNAQRQCDALLQGLCYMVPQRLLTLFTWAQLESLCCGAAEVDVELLRSRTKYVITR